MTTREQAIRRAEDLLGTITTSLNGPYDHTLIDARLAVVDHWMRLAEIIGPEPRRCLLESMQLSHGFLKILAGLQDDVAT